MELAGSEFLKKSAAALGAAPVGLGATWAATYLYTEEQRIRACKKNAIELEQQYPIKEMHVLEKLSERLGDSYPEALYLQPGLEDEQEQAWQAMQTAWKFWRKVEMLYERPGNELLHPGEKCPWRSLLGQSLPKDDGFFTRSWAGRGAHYRKLAEPIDILNYYRKNKHLESGHYADGIVDELADDNYR
ncbi:hypothetical protein WJX72_011631 [[Myrmecia] bisecta]|uniref:EDS1 EP domain-containing protein n=1 Tax=[Myrmecia] bisecta TaxID=41462 RepID=A0AAW1P889_9CHLO